MSSFLLRVCASFFLQHPSTWQLGSARPHTMTTYYYYYYYTVHYYMCMHAPLYMYVCMYVYIAVRVALCLPLGAQLVPASWVSLLLHAVPPCPHRQWCSALSIAVHAVLIVQYLYLLVSHSVCTSLSLLYLQYSTLQDVCQ